MNELKTLKDLPLMEILLRSDKNETLASLSKVVSIEELKAEAVRDIEIIGKAVMEKKDLDFLHKPTWEEGNAIKSYIKWKNNLTE